MTNKPSLIIALGSNIEPRNEFLSEAITHLKNKFSLIKISSIYESEPVDYLEQDLFLNMVAQFEIPNISPEKLLEELQSIEKEMQRHKTIDKGPRNIDLDIIFIGRTKIRSEKLNIPHLSWNQRNFVVYPLLDLDLEDDLRDKVLSFSKELTSPKLTEFSVR